MGQFSERLHVEWGFFKASWCWLLLAVTFQFIHNWMHNLVYYLSSKYAVYGGPEHELVDLGFKLLPYIEIYKMSFLPNNGVLYTLFGLFVLFLLLPFLSSCFDATSAVKFEYSSIQALWRFCMVCILTITFRVSSFIFTVLPSPSFHCAVQPASEKFKGMSFSPPRNADSIFGTVNTDNGCGDLIFSSHMMYGLLCTLTISSYFPLYRLVVLPVVWTLALALGLLIVIQHSHYTVDVVIAWYTVPLTWIAFRHYVPVDIKHTFKFWTEQPNYNKT